MSDPKPDPTRGPAGEPVPTAVVAPAPRRVSWAWVVPIALALALVVVLVVQAGRSRGPRIEIAFADAAGLEPGADLVHRGIRVGEVRAVELSAGMGAVRVEAELAPHAAGLAREGAGFWIVRPEVSLRRVEGLETLLGPRYIAVRPGEADAPRARRFVGLDAPPAPAGGAGLTVRLLADRAASVTPGSPVLYKDIPVGSVTRVALAPDASGVEIDATVRPPHDRLVRENSRFWRSGGVGVDFGLFRGLTVEADSLERLIQGSVSFATPERAGPRVGAGHAFELSPQPEESWTRWSPTIPEPPGG